MGKQGKKSASKLVKLAIRKAAKQISSKFLRRFRWNDVGSSSHVSPGQTWIEKARRGCWMIARCFCSEVECSDISLVEKELFYQFLNENVPPSTRRVWFYPESVELEGLLAPMVPSRLDLEVSPESQQAMRNISSMPFVIDEWMLDLILWQRDQQVEVEAKDKILPLHALEMFVNAPSPLYFCRNRSQKSGRHDDESRGSSLQYLKSARAAVSGSEVRHCGKKALALFREHCQHEYNLSETELCKLHTEPKDALKAGYSFQAVRDSHTMADIICHGKTAALSELDFAHSGPTLIRAQQGQLKDKHCNMLSSLYTHSHTLFASALRNACVHACQGTKKQIIKELGKPLTNGAIYGAGKYAVAESYLGIGYDKIAGQWNIPEDGSLSIPNLLQSAVNPDDDMQRQAAEIVNISKKYLSVFHRVFPFIRKYNQTMRDWASANPMGVIGGSKEVGLQMDPFTDDVKNPTYHRVTAWNEEYQCSESVTVLDIQEDTSFTGHGAIGTQREDSKIIVNVANNVASSGDTAFTIHDAVVAPVGAGPKVVRACRDAVVDNFTDPDKQHLVKIGAIEASNWRAPDIAKDAQLVR